MTMNLFLPGAIKSTGGGGYKPQQLPERVPHLKERTYYAAFLLSGVAAWPRV